MLLNIVITINVYILSVKLGYKLYFIDSSSNKRDQYNLKWPQQSSPLNPQEFHHRKPIKLVVIRWGYMVFFPFHLLVEFANGNNSTHKRSYSFKIN